MLGLVEAEQPRRGLEVELGDRRVVHHPPPRARIVVEQQPEAERQRAAEAAILNDPFVQSMMREFGAKIVPGSIQSV